MTRRIYRGPRGAATLSADLTPLRLAGLEVSALPGQELVFDLRTTAFEGLALSAGVLSGNRSVYTPQAADDDGVVMIGAAHGQGFIRQGGREAQAHDGDAFFMDPNRAYLYLAQPSRACAVRLSRTVMQSLGIDVDAALAHLMRYADVVHDAGAVSTAQMRRAIALHVHDLAALLAGATGDAAHLAQARGRPPCGPTSTHT